MLLYDILSLGQRTFIYFAFCGEREGNWTTLCVLRDFLDFLLEKTVEGVCACCCSIHTRDAGRLVTVLFVAGSIAKCPLEF